MHVRAMLVKPLNPMLKFSKPKIGNFQNGQKIGFGPNYEVKFVFLESSRPGESFGGVGRFPTSTFSK